MEDALYEIESMRRFAGLRLSDRLPDEWASQGFIDTYLPALDASQARQQ